MTRGYKVFTFVHLCRWHVSQTTLINFWTGKSNIRCQIQWVEVWQHLPNNVQGNCYYRFRAKHCFTPHINSLITGHYPYPECWCIFVIYNIYFGLVTQPCLSLRNLIVGFPCRVSHPFKTVKSTCPTIDLWNRWDIGMFQEFQVTSIY